MTSTNIQHRITSLERWGMRVHADFQPESVACIREAGFTGVLVNGGSGIGPDMLTPESLVESPVIPDLMPLTVKGNRREMARRCKLLQDAGLNPWLCLWGVPGPDESEGAITADSNRFFDRRSKLEMNAKLARTPELFGQRHPHALSWRGSRPLCVSHPTVQDFYRDLMTRLVSDYPDLEGIFFFPGDNEPEICHDCCPRCKATGNDQTRILTNYVNLLYEAVTAAKPDFKLTFTIWNQDKPESMATIRRFLDELHPGIGICMSISDNYSQPRKSGPMVFNQPWVNFAEPGERFLETTSMAHQQGRPVMVLGEISQAEVWDPVCHNLPNPRKVLDLLRNSEAIPGADAICDFWGHRSPFHSHANHAVMRAYYDDPGGEPAELLRRAAGMHYGIGGRCQVSGVRTGQGVGCQVSGNESGDANCLPETRNLTPETLLDQALDCWQRFDDVVDDWALNIWGQRFSYGIGRDAARGFLYRALIPANLRAFHTSWPMGMVRQHGVDAQAMSRYQEEDRTAFLAVAAAFDDFAVCLDEADASAAAALARREARNIELAGELLASEGRTFAAAAAFNAGDSANLRAIVEAEIEGRIRQQEISGRIGWGAGVNPILVDEDIQNMRLYLSRDDFPDTPDDVFHFTATPYSV